MTELLTRPLTRAELIEELDLLAGTDTWPNIAARLGTNLNALEKRLFRMGCHKWARQVRSETRPRVSHGLA